MAQIRVDVTSDSGRLRVYWPKDELCHVVSFDGGNGHNTESVIGVLEVETDDVKLIVDATAKLELLLEDSDKVDFVNIVATARRALLAPVQ